MFLKKPLIFILLFGVINLYSYAQKDVTQFLGIPVDGFKPDMIKKLRDKGFALSASNNDVLLGEFNGRQVNLHIGTNNNKVYRIMVNDENLVNEGDIKIRFNKLCQQFIDNKKYLATSDAEKLKLLLSDEEDISYEMSVHSKRYEAVFYQKTNDYDSLINALVYERINQRIKDSLDYKYDEQNSSTFKKLIDDKHYNKVVWFMINEFRGEYYISMFYDNNYNKSNGEDL
jgi:hypothetical protein